MAAIGFHTDAFNNVNWNFEQCLRWAKDHDLNYIECGTIDGAAYIQALGYYPHISLLEDPLLWRKTMDRYGIQFSQLDAAYPLNSMDGLTIGVQYIVHSIRWAKLVGCPCIDTTDFHDKPEGMTDRESLDILKKTYGELIPVAERYDIKINLEPHGYFTTKPDFVAEILDAYQSPCFGINMDTGNTFIAGQDPVAYLEQFIDRVNHVHIKDVSEELAKAARGEMTGIAMSHSAIGAGVNAENIKTCVKKLLDHGYQGVFSLECDGNLLEASLQWMRDVLK